MFNQYLCIYIYILSARERLEQIQKSVLTFQPTLYKSSRYKNTTSKIMQPQSFSNQPSSFLMTPSPTTIPNNQVESTSTVREPDDDAIPLAGDLQVSLYSRVC